MTTKLKNGKKTLALDEQVRLLLAKRVELSKLKTEYQREAEPIETEVAAISENIKADMKAQHLQSFRTEYGTPYLSLRQTPYVADEGKVIAWLKGKKLDKEYVAPRLTEDFYEKFLRDEATRVVKPDGVEVKETEVFGIRKPEENHER